MNDWLDIVLLVSGLVTATMALMVCFPQWSLKSFFAKEVTQPYTLFLAQSSALPVTTIGLLMVWSYFQPQLQTAMAIAAILSKAIFLGLILKSWATTGKGYALTIAVDVVSVVCLILCLL